MSTHGEGWVVLQVAAGLAVVVVAGMSTGPRAPHAARRAAAVGLGVSGTLIGLSAARSLGPALRAVPRPRPGAPLTSSGPYRVVRHPMYTSLLAFAAATAAERSLWALVPAAGLALVLDRKAALEEAWLTKANPSYADYREAVRWRFVPGLR